MNGAVVACPPCISAKRRRDVGSGLQQQQPAASKPIKLAKAVVRNVMFKSPSGSLAYPVPGQTSGEYKKARGLSLAYR